MSSLCNVCNRFHHFYVQTLPYNCSHIEDVQLLFCEQLINIYRLSEAVPMRPFFEQKMAENKDKNTNRLENNGCYSSISLVSVVQILASTK